MVMALSGVALLQACGTKTPACGDEQTVGILKSTYKDTINALFAAHEGGPATAARLLALTPLEVKTVQTVAKDAAVGMLTCEADLSVTVPEVIAKYAGSGAVSAAGPAVVAQTRNAKVTGNAITQPIRYTVQETDDRKQVVVKSEGVDAVAKLVGNLAFLALMEHALDLSGGTPAAALPASMPAATVAGASAPPPAAASGPPAAVEETGPTTVTRYGPITVNKDPELLFHGKPLTPPLGGNNSLDVHQKFEIGADDVLLIQNTGGTACPAQFHFVRVTASGAQATPAFGTCTDLVEVARDGDAVRVTMSGYMGSTQSNAEQEAAAKEAHIYVYRAGSVNEEASAKNARAATMVPSFACSGKLSVSEKLICATPALAQADFELARAYSAALTRAPDAAALKQQQRSWRDSRDACGDVACVEVAYTKRLAELAR